MRNQLGRTAALAVILGALAHGSAAAQSAATAFVRFNVVPMTRDTVLRDQTVLVTDGTITAVRPSKTVRVRRGAARVDGAGTQFLVPALADMHTHTANPAELALFASHGLLTILNLGWTPESFVALTRSGVPSRQARRRTWR